jgi:hypothetical protein
LGSKQAVRPIQVTSYVTFEPPTLRSTVRPPPGRIKGAPRHSVMASGHP